MPGQKLGTYKYYLHTKPPRPRNMQEKLKGNTIFDTPFMIQSHPDTPESSKSWSFVYKMRCQDCALIVPALTNGSDDFICNFKKISYYKS